MVSLQPILGYPATIVPLSGREDRKIIECNASKTQTPKDVYGVLRLLIMAVHLSAQG